jgi:L-seryl-tRNA(Ser) seleniumtransferase
VAGSKKHELFQVIPSVDRLLKSPVIHEITPQYPHNLILKAINEVLEEFRGEIKNGKAMDPSDLTLERVSSGVVERLKLLDQPSLRLVINATGVVVHTNLGRSILPEQALERFRQIAGGYSNLEYDLKKGERGSRYAHVESILLEITSAEGAMVVNNNAAAVLVSLETLAKDREVVVSRGELVEIGGSFRIPEVMRKSGAKMVEVGATNKTHLRDYEGAIGPDTALLLKVHKSNFHLIGFTEEVDRLELVKLGRRYGIPVMEDLGSGCFVDFSKYGLIREPTVQEVLAQGVDLVTFSGDKLLGGPQAGIILGRKDLIEAIRRNQLSRALRIDKLTLMALEETLRIYRDEQAALREIPTLRMILASQKSLKERARRLIKLVGKVETGNFTVATKDGQSKVGGGALPLLVLPTSLICLTPGKLSVNALGESFRASDPPIIVRIEKDQVLLDVRTLQEGELKIVAEAIRRLSQR